MSQEPFCLNSGTIDTVVSGFHWLLDNLGELAANSTQNHNIFVLTASVCKIETNGIKYVHFSALQISLSSIVGV